MPDSITQLFRHLVDASGLPVRLRDLGHGAVSLSLAAINDLRSVQALLGHASIILTANTYTSVLLDLSQHADETTARLITKADTNTPARPRRTRRGWGAGHRGG